MRATILNKKYTYNEIKTNS